ncbi:MAG: hypothetical protein WBH47_15600 [Streptosporangiaceae bacterium]
MPQPESRERYGDSPGLNYPAAITATSLHPGRLQLPSQIYPVRVGHKV